ncbi:hypothetical protein RYX36_021774 [Vicia faba]
MSGMVEIWIGELAKLKERVVTNKTKSKEGLEEEKEVKRETQRDTTTISEVSENPKPLSLPINSPRVSENPKPLSLPINSPRVSEKPPPPPSRIKLSELKNNSVLEELNNESIDEIETLAENNVTETVDKDGLVVRRVLKFNFVDDEIDGKFTEKTTEEFGDTKTDELEEKQHNVGDLFKKKESKK